MEPKPENPYAFPASAASMEHGVQLGMTLRDYFAAVALQGICGNSGAAYQANGMNGWALVNCDHNQVAVEAYTLATAMLKARSAQ